MNSEKTLVATIIMFMLVLSPAVPSNADRLTRRGNLLSNNINLSYYVI